MKKNSRFLKTAVAAGLVVCSGAAVLGVTSFVSAEIQDPENPAVVAEAPAAATETVTPVQEVPAPSAAAPTDESGSVSASDTPAASSSASTSSSTSSSTQVKRNSPISVAATALGMTEADLVTELQSGKSIADVATAKGVDIAKVTDALYADLKAHLDAEVAAGEHTQAEADAKLADAKTRIAEMVNKAGLPMRGKGGPGRGHDGDHGGRGAHGAPRFATESLAKVLGLSLDELNTQLTSGKTLAQIADAQKVEIQTVKDQLVADFTAKEQAEVTSGKHTQAEVDAKIAEFKTRLDDMVNGVRPAMGPGGMGDHGPMGGRGGKGGPGRHGDHGPKGDHGPMGGNAPADGTNTQGASFSA